MSSIVLTPVMYSGRLYRRAHEFCSSAGALRDKVSVFHTSRSPLGVDAVYMAQRALNKVKRRLRAVPELEDFMKAPLSPVRLQLGVAHLQISVVCRQWMIKVCSRLQFTIVWW